MKEKTWGEGWDYLLKDIWENLDTIRKDNLSYSHNEQLIDKCFNFIYPIFLTKILKLVKETDWSPEDKVEIINKSDQIRKMFKSAKTVNDKVIAINVAEQFLRAIY